MTARTRPSAGARDARRRHPQARQAVGAVRTHVAPSQCLARAALTGSLVPDRPSRAGSVLPAKHYSSTGRRIPAGQAGSTSSAGTRPRGSTCARQRLRSGRGLPRRRLRRAAAPGGPGGLLAALDAGWADPARLYRDARRARLLLDAAREVVAAVLGARPDEVTFTPSGTQAVHLAVLGGLRGRAQDGRASGALSAVEHSAVLHAAERHDATGGRASRGAGRPRRPGRPWTRSARPFRADTALACLQSAPTTRWARCSRSPRRPRAAPTAGCRCSWTPPSRSAGCRLPAGWSLLAASAHKWGGPPGVGVLVVRKGTRWRSPYPADERERGRVPGFENVPAIVAAAAALRARARRGGGRGGPAVRAGRPDPGPGRREPVPDVEVVGDPVRPAAAHRHVLLPVRRRRGAAAELDRRGLRGLLRLVLHVDARCARATCWRRWACSSTATSGSRCPAGPPRRTSTGSWPCCPAWSRRLRDAGRRGGL